MIEHLFTSMPMYVCGISTAFIAMKWRDFRTDALAWLTAFMLTATVLYACHYLYFNRVVGIVPVADTAYCLCNLLVYPLYFVYLSRLAVGSRLQNRLPRPWLLLLPSVVMAGVIGVLYAAMSRDECRTFATEWLYQGRWSGLHGLALTQAVMHMVAKVLFALQIVPVLLVGGRMIRQHDRFVIDNYADTFGKTLAGLHTLLIVLLATSVASFAANIIGRQLFVDSIWRLAIPSVLFSVLLFSVAYVGLTLGNPIADDHIDDPEQEAAPTPSHEPQPAAAPQPEPMAALAAGGRSQGAEPPTAAHAEPTGTPAEHNESDSAPQRPGDTADDTTGDPRNKIAELKAEIVGLLQGEQLFLNHDLRIADLTKRLGTNRNYIQQAISGEMGTTFSDLVNRMRIEHAVQLIQQHPAMPMTEVAERSGYRSLASFYRNFKHFKGCPPKELNN